MIWVYMYTHNFKNENKLMCILIERVCINCIYVRSDMIVDARSLSLRDSWCGVRLLPNSSELHFIYKLILRRN